MTSLSNDHLEHHTVSILQRFRERNVKFAIIGGMAVAVRTVERLTKDVDFAVAVVDDREAEDLVLSLSRSGYFVQTVIEQDEARRLSTVRLISQGEPVMFVAILFASSGIESEVVAAAEIAELFPGITGPVATIPSLIALKVLSANAKNRLQDIIDLQYLLKDGTDEEIAEARSLLNLITERGFNRKKDLLKDLDRYIEQFQDV